MNTANRCCYMCTESRLSIRTVSNYRSLLFLGLVLVACSWFIQGASAQTPSGILELVGPSTDPSPDDESFEVSVEILNPQNVSVFSITIEYPSVFGNITKRITQPGDGQFDIVNLSITNAGLVGGRISSQLNLGINYDAGRPVFITEGTLFTLTFPTPEIGNYQIEIVDGHLQDGGATVVDLDVNRIPILTVSVLAPIQGTVSLVPAPGVIPPENSNITGVRVNETSFIDIELKDRSRIQRYEITVNPSENLGALTVSYNADDFNGTAITNHTAGDPVTLGAELSRPNDSIDDTDLDLADGDQIVATVFFTPTAAGEASFEITSAKIYTSAVDTDGEDPTLPDTNPLTFTILKAKEQVTEINTGVGPTPIIRVNGGTETNPFTGPFEVEISFKSENYIKHKINNVASLRVQRGVYGFARDEVMVSGAGASVTTRFWEPDGGELYYARVNPTETSAADNPLEVEISVLAGAVKEVGTNLLNVASETVTVYVQLDNPPWDVSNDGVVDVADLELVEGALGQGLEARGDGALYVYTIVEPRTDVNGDKHVDQLDIDLVKMHIPDEEGGTSGQAEGRTQARGGIVLPQSAATWMPDANLRSAIRDALGIADDKDFTQEQVATLTELTVKNVQISNITGLEHAINLTRLNLADNQISNLKPLSGLTNLTHLWLEGNDIINIKTLKDLTNLTFLVLKVNNISNIRPLKNLTELTKMWLSRNEISDVSPLKGLVKLQRLHLANNPILDTSPLYSLTQGALKRVDISISEYPPWDVNEDGTVDEDDSALVTAALGQTGADIADPRTDINGDGTVDNADLTLVTDNLDAEGGAPSNVALSKLMDREVLETLDRGTLQAYLASLRAESDGSLKYLRAIALLESILAAIRPDKTQLLANYPNPFNPETWIPYQLANASDVQILIYDTAGGIVRRLELGHQPEGYYTSKSRAAYWDGRNTFGERVASGIYFYQLQANNISLLRKLLILK